MGWFYHVIEKRVCFLIAAGDPATRIGSDSIVGRVTDDYGDRVFSFDLTGFLRSFSQNSRVTK
ncbi:hypothetical protein DCC26_08080 [Auritidibacter sp. NML120779]|nr:hypothetical protein DCC26_08080 [Auritidibacter sp. NML120779]